MAAGVTSPRSVASTFRKMGPCFVTLYGIKSYSANDVFRCRVVEPTSPSLVTVEISNVAGDVIASSHSMFQTELPTKKQVAKRLKGFPYTKTYYDLKLLIRGRNDWAICYGRVSGNSKVKLWLYLLKTRKRVEIEQPSKTSYKIKLYNVKDYIEVDTSSRDITIPRDVDDVPEILALCFSLRTLIQFKCEEEVSYVIEASRQRRLSKYSTIGR
ncbi:uncharacterized protein LOC124449300 [Xenia sp. Carnegie-2017]|uniref:uncharacterized protein LOC124449300 n=1 Tax=Xenia sp. Carnegie-2017 TaxID=2897299 RepID=UPI001F0393B7|nr:uncharacterized protein LOC124449300 [Xenia sp. Carnegie-2017]